MRPRRPLLASTVVALAAGTILAAPGPAVAGGSCSGEPVSAGRGQTVQMKNDCFLPTVLHATPGEAVTFVNRDVAAHTVTGAGGWGSGHGEVLQGEAIRIRLVEPGLYLYACLLHPGMMGAVYVGEGKAPAVAGATAVATVELGGKGTAKENTTGAQAAYAEAASADARSPGLPAGAALVLGLGAAGAGYGLSRLRRRPGDADSRR